MKKLLILSATAGAGHVRAADALVKTATLHKLPLEIVHRDILTFTLPIFRKVYSEVNNKIAGYAPELWGFLYKTTDAKSTTKGKHPVLQAFDSYNFKKYVDFLRSERPSAVLCTHFLPYAAIAEELKKQKWDIPFFSVPTDYDVHSLWVHPSVQRYYVATDEAAWSVRSRAIPHDRILATGIPVHPEFCLHEPTSKARKELGLEPRRLTLMALSGGYGIGIIDKLIPAVLDFLGTYKRHKFTLLVVCGKNKKLYQTLSRHNAPENVSFKCYEFVSNIHTLMSASDALITKSGGLTVSEALAKHLPMLIFDPVPGQEGRNADYITEHGVAFRTSGLANLTYKLHRIIEQPELLAQMKERAISIAKPHAAIEILNDVLNNM